MQLFNKLYMQIEDCAPPLKDKTGRNGGEPRLSVNGADGKSINPAKWSKADVLEGALNVIQDLRRQLVEERLARTLGVAPGCSVLDAHELCRDTSLDADQLALKTAASNISNIDDEEINSNNGSDMTEL